ncbi:MAG: hypothetical protein ACRC80_04085 [Waterburya sp.]
MQKLGNPESISDILYIDSDYFFYFDLKTIFKILEFLDIFDHPNLVCSELHKIITQTKSSTHVGYIYTTKEQNGKILLYRFSVVAQLISRFRVFPQAERDALYQYYQDWMIRELEERVDVPGQFEKLYGQGEALGVEYAASQAAFPPTKRANRKKSYGLTLENRLRTYLLLNNLNQTLVPCRKCW